MIVTIHNLKIEWGEGVGGLGMGDGEWGLWGYNFEPMGTERHVALGSIT